MLRRLLAAVLSAGIVLGGAAPVAASESANAGLTSLDGKKKAKSGKKKGKKKGKKGKKKKGKKAAKKPAVKKPTKKKAKKAG